MPRVLVKSHALSMRTSNMLNGRTLNGKPSQSTVEALAECVNDRL